MSGALLKPYKNALIAEVGRDAMYDDTINAIGKREFGRRWGGTYASDALPALKANRFYIVNTDVSAGPGVHWIGLYVSPAKVSHLYDSFARPAKNVSRRTVGGVAGQGLALEEANGVGDQRGDSGVCGQLTLAWLQLVRDRGIRAASERRPRAGPKARSRA